MKHLSEDKDIYSAIEKERKRQQNDVELIASENYASPAVMKAAGTCFTNKYAEGTPGNRFYGGCENADEVLASSSLKKSGSRLLRFFLAEA